MRHCFSIRSFCLKTLTLSLIAVLFASFAWGQGNPEALEEEYVIGAEDVLNITVWDNKDLTGNVRVELDGYITYKYVGRVKAFGLTTSQLAKVFGEKLADGYINDPQVTVQVATFRSKEIFIIGEVNRPGTYYLSKKTTIVEAISMAQGPTNDADSEVTIVRQAHNGQGENITVSLLNALEGDMSQNILVLDGDSIFINKAKTFFIMGEVNRPGQYKLEKDTSVRKAISIAGGHTERAALGRVKIIRDVEGEENESEVQLEEAVVARDTIVVPQSYF